MKKYELTDESIKVSEKTLYRIKALISFGNVNTGDLGGYIESEKNLEQSCNAWVSDDAQVYGNAQVSDDAQVYGNAQVSGDALVSGDARVYGNAQVSGDARVLSRKHIAWFSSVGSEFGTLTVYTTESGIGVTRGCFRGSLEQFEAAVRKTHKDNEYAQQYMALINYIKLRFQNMEVKQ